MKNNVRKNGAASPEELLAQDNEAIRKQLAKGVPLKAHQRLKIEAQIGNGGDSQAPNFAKNFNQLAGVLGVRRQVIYHHSRKPDCPQPRENGRHSVAEWREYLAANGRLEVQSAGGGPSDELLLQAQERGCGELFQQVSANLPALVETSFKHVGISATPAQVDALTVSLWTLLLEMPELEGSWHDWELEELPGPLQEVVRRWAASQQNPE